MKCHECPHWQGGKYSQWGDCYRIVGILEPRFFNCVDDNGYPFSIPFDPHRTKYLNRSAESPYRDSNFKYLMNGLKRRKNLPSGIRKRFAKKSELVFNDNGVGTVKKLSILFIQTHRDLEDMCDQT